MVKIATIRTDFKEKFGLPRQSGLVPELTGRIVFEPAYRNPQALKGLSDFSHLWIIWECSMAQKKQGQGKRKKESQQETQKAPHWNAMVKPPRLGGNENMGVFATRSPFRPNPIGLSCVKIDQIKETEKEGTVIFVSGIDLLDGTPIYDIKPYLPYADSHPEATSGFAGEVYAHALDVVFPKELLLRIPEEKRPGAMGLLRQDPRPAYQDEEDRIYGVSYAGFNIRFQVKDDRLTVIEVEE